MFGSLDSSHTLYDRIGGKAAVAAAVDVFYGKVTKDPLLLPFFNGVDLNRQRAKMGAFLTAVFGGPTKYAGQDLRRGHAHLVALGLGDKHFDAVAHHLEATLKQAAVPAPLIKEVLGIVANTRADVLNR